MSWYNRLRQISNVKTTYLIYACWIGGRWVECPFGTPGAVKAYKNPNGTITVASVSPSPSSSIIVVVK